MYHSPSLQHPSKSYVRQRTSSTSSTSTFTSTTTTASSSTMAPIKSLSKRNGENVQVTVRCRPPNKSEYGSCWDVQNSKVISKDQRLKKQHEFHFGIENNGLGI